jgi:hypothetical protein
MQTRFFTILIAMLVLLTLAACGSLNTGFAKKLPKERQPIDNSVITMHIYPEGDKTAAGADKDGRTLKFPLHENNVYKINKTERSSE